MDCQNRARSLAVRLGEPQRHVEALLELLEMAVDAGEAELAGDYLRAILDFPEAPRTDLRRLYAGLERTLDAVASADRGPALRDALELAARQSGEAEALARLSIARWHRGQGDASVALGVLVPSIAWARGSGHIDAEIALRSEEGACLLAVGRVADGQRTFEVNLRAVEALPEPSPDAVARARRNWEAALEATD